MSQTYLREAQRAFTGLLAKPLVTVRTDPALYRAVQRHHKHINDSTRRLGYRTQQIGRAIRLLRLPVLGEVTAPAPPLEAPTRRVRALACVLAAACEEIEGGVTLQKLSDLAAEISSATSKRIAPYEPDQLAHRRQLVRAVAILEEWGVLHRRSVIDRLEEWTESRSGIGAGFEVDRDALLLFMSPEVVNQAVMQDPDDLDQRNATRTLRLLRAMVETPAVLYADLDLRDAEDLRGTRGLRATEANHMVGGHIEARREGLVMLIVDDAVRCPVNVEWPTHAAGSWLSLVIADLAGRQRPPDPDTGVVHLSSSDVDDVVDQFMGWRGQLLPQAYRNNPAAVRIEAERQLSHLGLLRLAPHGDTLGCWLLLPAAGRYRDPDVVLPEMPPRDPIDRPADGFAALTAQATPEPDPTSHTFTAQETLP